MSIVVPLRYWITIHGPTDDLITWLNCTQRLLVRSQTATFLWRKEHETMSQMVLHGVVLSAREQTLGKYVSWLFFNNLGSFYLLLHPFQGKHIKDGAASDIKADENIACSRQGILSCCTTPHSKCTWDNVTLKYWEKCCSIALGDQSYVCTLVRNYWVWTYWPFQCPIPPWWLIR